MDKAGGKLPSIKPGGKKGGDGGGGGGKKGGKKKEPLNLFPTQSVLDYHDPVVEANPEDMRNGEFDATELYFNPSQSKGECSLTIGFRCTCKLVCGDTITIRLGSFKGGKAQVFALESRPNEDFENMLKDMHEKSRAKQTSPELRFQAYYSGDAPPKGIPPQSIILRCRFAVEENMRVVFGVPESVRICLPEKLAANSTKIKIEGVVKHAQGGKIARSAFKVTDEVKKKRPIDVEIAELEELLDFYAGGRRLKKKKRKGSAGADGEGGDGEAAAEGEEGNEDGESSASDEDAYEDDEDDPDAPEAIDMAIVQEIGLAEVDQISENAHHRRQLSMGLRWVVESSVFHSYEASCQFAARTLNEAYERAKRGADELFLHREIAANFGVKLSQVLVLEDCLNTIHGAYYPGHSRAAIMVMRLYTMEAHDLGHLFGVLKAPCAYREIHSAIRSKNAELLNKWAFFVLALSTTPMNLREYTFSRQVNPPPLYVGLKDLPHDELVRMSKLRPDDFYMTTNFYNCVANVNIEDDEFSPPDTGVLLELRGVLNAVEIGDCSHYPADAEWLLPMFTSFSVAGVENHPTKNHLIKIILDFKGSFGGLSDLRLPPAATEDRNRFKMAVSISGTGGISLALRKMAQTTARIVKCIGVNLRLRECRLREPAAAALLHAKYLQQYASQTRQSRAAQNINEGLVKWFYAPINTAPDGTRSVGGWLAMKHDLSVEVEVRYLMRTRALKAFEISKPNGGPVFCTGNFDAKEIALDGNPAAFRREVGKTTEYPYDPFM